MGQLKLTALLALLAAPGAFAQALPPASAQADRFKPINFDVVDDNGVDLSSGQFTFSTGIAIGGEAGGFKYTVSAASGRAWLFASGLRGNIAALARETGNDEDPYVWDGFQVTTPFGSEFFPEVSKYPALGQPLGERGGRLVQHNDRLECDYISRDGTVVTMSRPAHLDCYGTRDMTFVPVSGPYFVTRVVRPDGEIWNYQRGAPGTNYFTDGIVSVTTNRGYGLRFEFSAANYPSAVYLFSTSAADCSSQNNNCELDGGVWPQLRFAYVPGAAGRVQSITDAAGNQTTFSYIGGEISQIQFNDGRITTLEYGATHPRFLDGRLLKPVAISRVRSGQKDVNYVWSSAGATRTSSAGTQDQFGVYWNEAGMNVITDVRDGLGRVTTVAYIGGLFGWEVDPRLAQVTNPDGSRMTYDYDVRRNVTRVQQLPPPGQTGNLTWTAVYGEPGSVQICQNQVTCNQPIVFTNPRGFSTRLTWSPTTGQLIRAESGLTGPANALTCGLPGGQCPTSLYTYISRSARYYENGVDISGPPISVLSSTETCPTQAICAPGTAVRVEFQYINAGMLNRLRVEREVRSGTGVQPLTTTFTYDERGNRTSVDRPRPGSDDAIYQVYDVLNRVEMVISPDPDGSGPAAYQAERTTYLGGGTLIASTARGIAGSVAGGNFAALETVNHSYDAAGQRIRTVSPAGVTQFSYDAAGRPTCTAVRLNPSLFASLPASACTLGAEGSFGPDRITRSIHDAASQLTELQRAVGTPLQQSYARYGYTLTGQRQYVLDANNNRTDYLYDGFDRLIRMNLPAQALGSGVASGTDFEGYSYDPNGNIIARRLRSGEEIAFSFDALDRQTLKEIPGGGAQDVHYGYDLRGLQTSARFGSPTGPGLSSVYDGFGRLVSQTTTMSGGPSLALSFAYDANGNRTRMTWPDGNFIDYTYDAGDRARAVLENGAQSGAGVLATFTYDALGRRTTIVRAGGGGAVTSYAYDQASRLVGLAQDFAGSAADVNFSFAHNPASQIVQRTTSNADFRFPAPPSNIAYQRNGLNQYTDIGGAGIGYDPRGNLTADGGRTFAYDFENRLIAAQRLGFPVYGLSYDPSGRLQRLDGAVASTVFLYDGDRLVGEYDAGGTVLRRYAHGPGVDEPLVWYEGGGLGDRRWLLADRQGSVIATAGPQGQTLERYRYGPFGEPAQGDWSGPRFRYTGQAALPELQLYHYKARVYDPGFGRFLQTDPVGYEDDFNLYAYVGNDPLNSVDPSGLYECSAGQGACSQISQYIREAASAAGNLPPDERVAVERATSAYGASGEKNGVTVTSGDLRGGALGMTSFNSRTGAITVTFDFEQIYRETMESFGSIETGREHEFIGAGVAGHEGDHVASFQEGMNPRGSRSAIFESEISAYSTENSVHKGLGSGLAVEANALARAVQQGAANSTNTACRAIGGCDD